ncbi:hypothetical protein NAEGRDRAFT_82289 [Naegleria gruberi]|uniref:Uncharacterized protein n=1 Tax=Naegleria gruberi TaxID=5762 RepID=D2W415_NAEGR|nr:uncharacterized protein NAEGRDRAFT_82289 [Naegleria gruberi]EFC36180.1 hypothetical protein NAEGRDRAFT_82289 [Naegleria gruberi]|eukprot:XP_002668924.1 hypothetical protein NAEGRDRAFT_82289 [Naegleria gruberi strain NEG-M]
MQQDNTPYAQFDNVQHAQPQQYYTPQQYPQYNTTTTATPQYDPYADQPPVAATSTTQTSQYYSGGYVQPHYDDQYHKKKNDDMTLLLFIVGLFIPLVWIVLFFITRDKTKYSNRARTLGNVGCGLIVASIICYAVFIVIIVAVNIARMDPSMQVPLHQPLQEQAKYAGEEKYNYYYDQPPPYYTTTTPQYPIPPQMPMTNTAMPISSENYYPPQNGGYVVQQYPGQTTTQQTTTFVSNPVLGDNFDLKKKNDDMAFVIFLIGFCFPIIWLILFAMTRNRMNYSDRGRRFGNIGGGLFACFVVLDIAVVILIVVLNNVVVRRYY